ncbi:ABC transporter substrate-binding protein [Hahella aquimaris]|uniref:ABC transporter substrate-binding protein n=1 Tax=Hahella sp. HNIBRBA332 TaxID=3015983 RepID=UPI00273B08E8|nr:ABC transporter substrate-binding protein [Hahella sp. HNIBRBA332]WLQ14683.1 ABC transporter substrate-binding protein [Hahella sp. HNIBRBA332]
MKKLLITLVSVLAFSSAQAKDWKEIRIGVDATYPPFASKNAAGELEGFDIEIGNALCAEMKAKCEWVVQDWDGIIPALLARKYDAILSSMSITEERREKVLFSDKYYNTPSGWVAKKGAGIDPSDMNQLKGKSVGVQRGTIQDTYVSEELKDVVNIKRYAGQDEAYLDMKAGRLDLLFVDALAADGGFLKKEAGQEFEFAGPMITEPVRIFGEGAGIAVRKRDTDLANKFNAAIKKIRGNGVYKKINDKYFEIDVYGK